uniref:Uncharacterized protein n=1 Tax=Anguilla anguilla TaxID=7936 RepID=A0A0E9WSI7_ANGAN
MYILFAVWRSIKYKKITLLRRNSILSCKYFLVQKRFSNILFFTCKETEQNRQRICDIHGPICRTMGPAQYWQKFGIRSGSVVSNTNGAQEIW